MKFEWDENKNAENIEKHGLSFYVAQKAFFDSKRVIISDEAHSEDEERFFCIGTTGEGIATVRFTVRGKAIRIIGAGYWRKGRTVYEESNRVERGACGY
jgi:uncharacterized DUF497 family protein